MNVDETQLDEDIQKAAYHLYNLLYDLGDTEKQGYYLDKIVFVIATSLALYETTEPHQDIRRH